MTDNINQPAHYTAGGIETIDVIEQVLGKYDHRDQVEKYNQRAHLKGNFQQDLEKARWYLNRTIENCEKGKLDPGTGDRVVQTVEEPKQFSAVLKFDPATVHRDAAGDYWVFDDPTQAWNWYTLSEDLSSVEKHGGTYTVEEIENHFDTYFIKPVALMRTERLVREAVERFDNPKIVLGETDPADMPVGTVAYRDGERFSYSARKEDKGWVLSHQPFFYHTSDEIAANWFKNEPGWSLEKPSDVYKDDDGDYWVHTGDGWRWHCILQNGKLEYRSIRAQEFEDIEASYSLEKLSDDDARRVRRIIQEGEK